MECQTKMSFHKSGGEQGMSHCTPATTLRIPQKWLMIDTTTSSPWDLPGQFITAPKEAVAWRTALSRLSPKSPPWLYVNVACTKQRTATSNPTGPPITFLSVGFPVYD
mmetsp:Transcript_135328/g.234654  ORF Transcript_135328/g.234654 Transcript_135328/m.234654 type:complete len:108 (+) Transcript_135328:6026-6349(+)